MTYYTNDRAHTYQQAGRTSTITLDPLTRPRTRTETGADPETLNYGDDTDSVYQSDRPGEMVRFISGLDGNLAGTWDSLSTKTALELTNVHGDTVGEANNSASSTGPTTTWETDEFGVPRKPIEPNRVSLVSTSTATEDTGAPSITVNKPANVQPGDVLIAVITTLPYRAPAGPSGWTSAAQNTGSQTANTVYWHVVGTSEPTSYNFYNGSHEYQARAGMAALRGADTTYPVAITTFSHGTTTDITAPAVYLGTQNTAVLRVVDSAAGDGDGGGAWSFPTGIDELWDINTGSGATNSNQAAGLQQIINGYQQSTPSFTVTNQTGQPAAAWDTTNVVIAPKAPEASQYRYHYLGTRERPVEMPSGVIGMGQRTYLPQLGRFLQTDPVFGGSANTYDYTSQDPVNSNDLTGQATAGGHCIRGTKAYRPSLCHAARVKPVSKTDYDHPLNTSRATKACFLASNGVGLLGFAVESVVVSVVGLAGDNVCYGLTSGASRKP